MTNKMLCVAHVLLTQPVWPRRDSAVSTFKAQVYENRNISLPASLGHGRIKQKRRRSCQEYCSQRENIWNLSWAEQKLKRPIWLLGTRSVIMIYNKITHTLELSGVSGFNLTHTVGVRWKWPLSQHISGSRRSHKAMKDLLSKLGLGLSGLWMCSAGS